MDPIRMSTEAIDALVDWINNTLARCPCCHILFTADVDHANTCVSCGRTHCPSCSEDFGRWGAHCEHERVAVDAWRVAAADGWVCSNCIITPCG